MSIYFGANRNPALHMCTSIVMIRHDRLLVHFNKYVFSSYQSWFSLSIRLRIFFLTSLKIFDFRLIPGSNHLTVQQIHVTSLKYDKITLPPVSRWHCAKRNIIALLKVLVNTYCVCSNRLPHFPTYNQVNLILRITLTPYSCPPYITQYCRV